MKRQLQNAKYQMQNVKSWRYLVLLDGMYY